jgi:hypothetical protein
MEADIEEILPALYDRDAVAQCVELEEMLARRLPEEILGSFVSILNAVEYQVEQGQANPMVLRHLGEAILALAVAHHLPVPLIKDITQLLGALHAHVVALAS